ncbi:MAG: hypothetical protein GF393_11135, partial [Armatimonadia bacterium]|nr:hypothetical protein [Armatimonadia bacterium]
MKSLDITVRDMSSLDTLRPVTGGVPIAEGAAPEGARFTLTDADGASVPLQTDVLARWKDGSARWVLLDLQSAPPADGEAVYALAWGDEAGPEPKTPCVASGCGRTIICGERTVDVGDRGRISIDGRIDVEMVAFDAGGGRCTTELNDAVVLASG